ncbi:MAG: GntR family transcriptional regulator [Candidatus Thermoplasmatota archaeon]|nr:GntR family transcriptional regulator [Candidatus Thermoplasmatota archaeon]
MEAKEKLNEVAYKHIFDGILQGKFRPGTFLNIDDISASLNISKTPIREALLELEGEGLIIRNGRYYHIFSPSRKEIMDLYEIRRILEGEAAGLAAVNPPPALIDDLGQTITRIEELSKLGDPDPIIFADLSGKFHSLICAGSGNQLLSKIVGDIRLRLKIVRVTSFTSFNRRKDDLLEHKAVFKAIKDRNPSLAKELMIDHQNKVIEYVKRELLMQFYE